MQSEHSKDKSVNSDATMRKLSKKERRKLKIEERQSPQTENASFQHGESQTREIIMIDDAKSKAQLRAERRELQEKQRMQKEQLKQVKEDQSSEKHEKTETTQKQSVTPPKAALNQRKVQQQRVQLLSHLKRLCYTPQTSYPNIHAAFVRLGAQYATKMILGADARCLALLTALKQLINDFQTPHNQELCRAFETHLNRNVEHLQQCRPIAVSMSNALRYFKMALTQVSAILPDDEKKKAMRRLVENYVEDEIGKAAAAISEKVGEKIVDGDVILTYGHSSLVNRILIDAQHNQRQFHVIVVDARPLLEGRRTVQTLVDAGIDTSYVLISAACFIMSRATKVIVGAHALLNNGYVMARSGTALIALIARTHMKPVLVCAETSKFTERAQTDSFVYNEIGDPNEIMNVKDDKDGYLNALNLMYDVTPPKYVTGVATELGILPCTSVPVILRLKPTE